MNTLSDYSTRNIKNADDPYFDEIILVQGNPPETVDPLAPYKI